jgi:hypothetical protein
MTFSSAGPREPLARHLAGGQGEGGSPKVDLATRPDPFGMGIPIDFPCRRLLLSLVVSTMWTVPPWRRPRAAPSISSGQVSGAAFQAKPFPRRRSCLFPSSCIAFGES